MEHAHVDRETIGTYHMICTHQISPWKYGNTRGQKWPKIAVSEIDQVTKYVPVSKWAIICSH